MYVNIRFKNSKKQKYYSKHRIVSWKILGKLRIKGNLKNQKPKPIKEPKPLRLDSQ